MVTDRLNTDAHVECVEQVQQYIRMNISEPLQREVLADMAGFSIPHFHRIFTACTGESAVSYVRRIRLERAACKLRAGAVDITVVALAAGYDSHAAFSKAFKKQYGLSPSEFRNLQCHEATQIIRKGKNP